MDQYNPDEAIDLQSALQQIALLRKQSLQGQPQGQVITGRYVAPSRSQQLLPVLQGVAADIGERNANEQKKAMDAAAQADLAAWINRRPQAKENIRAGDEGPVKEVIEPTDQEQITWAAQGQRNPLAKSLSGDLMKDQIVTSLGRREKLENKLETARMNSENLAAQREATKTNLILSLNQRSQDLATRLASEEARGQDTNATRMAIAENTRSLQELKGAQALALQDRKNEGAAGVAGAKATGGPRMSASQQKELADLGAMVQQVKQVHDDFKPEYSGPTAWAKTVTAPYSGMIPGVKPSDEDTNLTTYWQQYKGLENVRRHALFGSALTAGEQKAWAESTVDAKADADAIRKSLAVRLKIAQDVLNRKNIVYSGGSIDPQTGKGVPRASNLPRATGGRTPPQTDQTAAATPLKLDPGVANDQQQLLLDEFRSASEEDKPYALRALRAAGYKGPVEEAAPEAAPARKRYNPASGRLE